MDRRSRDGEIPFLGFENVGWTEDGNERVYVLQNSAYRLPGVGIGKAVDVIQKLGLPYEK